ncbi:MAG: cytochrome c [Rhodobacteraceae bacterium]|nr:cytochrome c [Paracoccaceae bacterium]
MKVFLAFAAIIAIGIASLYSLSFMKPDPVLEAQVRGQIIYDKSCAACHGINLEGQENWRIQNADGTMPAPPHSVEGHTWHHDDGMLINYTKVGGQQAMADLGITDFKSGMPAFGEVLTDDQISDVWAYIKSTWTDRERAAQAERTAAQALADG